MKSRYDSVPDFARRADQVPARLYNLWRLARARIGLPLELDLPGLKGLQLVIEEDAWVCIDPLLSDLPILAWTGFERCGRSSLVEPVACELRYYHFGGSMVRGRVLELMERLLDERLGQAAGSPPQEET